MISTGSRIYDRAGKYQARSQRRRHWYHIVTALSCVVVFCTTYALILPAITMERPQVLDCPLAIHTHTDACYDGQGALICGQADFVVHTHTTDCYDAGGEPVCPLPEIEVHTHTDACYTEQAVLICGLEEGGGTEEAPEHLHSENCYAAETVLTCGREEISLHQHTDACYDAYGALACGQLEVLEHIHGDDCFYFPETEDQTSLYEEDDDAIAAEAVLLEDSGMSAGAAPADTPTAQADTDTDQTIGNSFTLTYTDADSGTAYTITFEIVDDSGNPLESDFSTSNRTAEAATRYIFGAKDPSTAATDPVVEKIAPLIAGYAYVGASNVVGDNTVWPNWSGEVFSVGTNGYTDAYGTASGFKFYVKEPIEETQYLTRGNYNYTVTLTYRRHSQDHSGTWAIVNQQNGTDGVAMMAGDVDNTQNRPGMAVSLVQLDGSYYVRNGDVTQWTFEKQENGTYHIYTQVDGESAKQYLNIGTYGDPVTLSDEPQDIYVDEGSGFYPGVHLYVIDDDGYEDEVNLFSGSADSGFGSYGDGSRNSYHTLCRVMTGDYLYYNLNTPSMNSKGTGWKTAPSLDSTMQVLGEDDAALYAQPAGFTAETGPAGMEGLYRFNIQNTDFNAISGAGLLDDNDLPQEFKNTWYGEERFDGWTYTADGVTYLFDPETPVTRNSDGTMQAIAKAIITNDDETETIQPLDEETPVTLPSGATLTGHWTEISNVVTFFVNYKGTILDTEGDVTGRRTDTFTRSPAVGHVFYGKQTVGADKTFAVAADQEISSYFSPAFDPDNPNPQIVIAYLRTCTKSSTTGEDYETAMNTAAPGANNAMVEANTLQLLRETGRTVQVATSEGNYPTIDNSLCDSDHYQIRWYVMKEQTDTWHIDGVLVAKTAELTVTKTFSGLTAAEVASLLNKDSGDGYQIPVTLGEDGEAYLTMTTQSLPGQYEYTDTHTENMQSYRWTLHAITGEKYDLSETNYQLDGYDTATQVVHYYKDSSGKTVYDYANGDTTRVLEYSDVIGGTTSAVSFNNFYTPTGTGLLSLAKRAENSATALQGAVFTLYNKDDKKEKNPIATATSNANGAVYFSGLEDGTYWLKETTPPTGYEEYGGYWKVKVDEDDGTVTIQAYEADKETEVDEKATTCYNSETGEIFTYTINNDPQDETITIVKEFSGLTAEQMEALVAASKVANKDNGCYYIDLSYTGGAAAEELYLSDAAHDQTGFVYTWTLTGVKITADWTLTEHNYLMQKKYADTVVTVIRSRDKRTTTDEGTTSEYSSESLDAALDYTNNTAAVSFQFHADDPDEGIDYSNRTITVTNHYTNTFDLKLRKVDSTTREPLANASFKVYGPYSQAVDTNDSITYQGSPYYYIGTTQPSGTDGYTTWPGLSLSQSGTTTTFVYYLSEWQSPDGYVKLDEPLAASVTVGVNNSNYSGGVLTMNAPNTREEDYVHTALDTPKLWSPYAPTDATVTLELYRVTHAERNVPLENPVDAELVAAITLDGTADETQTAGRVEGIQVYESAPWVATWMNLYSASKDYTEDNPEHYHYFIREVSVTNAGGFVTTYTCLDAGGKEPDGAFQTLRVGDETFQGILLADMDEAYAVTVTNTAYFELPETGGPGTLPYTIGGALLAAASLLYGYGLRRRRERGSTR